MPQEPPTGVSNYESWAVSGADTDEITEFLSSYGWGDFVLEVECG